MNRRGQRETIFKLLFIAQFNPADEMNEQEKIFLDSLKEEQEKGKESGRLSREDTVYIHEKLEKILADLPRIDAVLNDTSKGWKTSRMAKVDLSILRLAVYEIQKDSEIPLSVAINEAVEIAKKYGGEDSASFVNGILGEVARKAENDSE